MDTLNPQQERFAQEYATDLNATRAVIRAGYSSNGASVQGTRLLANASVAKRVDELKREITIRLEVTQERIVREYAKIAFTDLQDVMDWFNADPKLIASGEIDAPAHGAISEIARTVSATGATTTKIKLHDKKGALDSLAKYHGMFTDRLDLSGTVKTESTFWMEFQANKKTDGDKDTREP